MGFFRYFHDKVIHCHGIPLIHGPTIVLYCKGLAFSFYIKKREKPSIKVREKGGEIQYLNMNYELSRLEKLNQIYNVDLNYFFALLCVNQQTANGCSGDHALKAVKTELMLCEVMTRLKEWFEILKCLKCLKRVCNCKSVIKFTIISELFLIK